MSKAERTREHLRATALQLFVERGYDQTTVADIAATAGVTPMTFFRHFASKERVVIDDPYDPAIAEAVRAQPRELPVFERVRHGMIAAWDQISTAEDAELRRRLAIGAVHPGLRARMRENNADTEAAIVDVLVADGVPRFEATVAAAAVLGALTAALLQWATGQGPTSLGAAVAGALSVLGAGSGR